MKKILLFLTLGFIYLISSTTVVNASTDSFYEAEYIDNTYMVRYDKKTGTKYYQKARTYRRTSDGKLAYCLQPFTKFNPSDNTYETVSSLPDISNETLERIRDIVGFGYGYSGHNDDLKWYAATQIMIWQTVEPDSEFYFTDTLNGNRIEKYEKEMRIINNLIDSSYVLPSFNNQTFYGIVGKPLTFEDTNNIISRFGKPEDITVKDNKIVEFLDYKEKLQNLFKEYSCVYYKPHPYVTKDSPNENFIRQRPNIKIINENIYKILCDDNVKAVAALSSGTLIEAKYFHKKTHTISHDFINYYNSYKDFNTDDFIIIDNKCFSSQFWSEVLSAIIQTNAGSGLLLNYPPNYLRDSLNTWWGYEVGCSKDYVNQELYYINQHFIQIDEKIRTETKPQKILKKLVSILIPNKKLRRKMRGDE